MLSPIKIDYINYKDISLKAKKEFIVNLEFDEIDEFIYTTNEVEEYGISVYGETVEDIIFELNLQVAVLWAAYAKELDQNLSEDAKKLKYKLLETFEEIK